MLNGRSKIYSAQEQIQLFKNWKYNECKVSYERLIGSNIRAVMKEAHKVAKYNQNLDIEDLIQEGMLGLVTAVEKFDESENVNFLTYAMQWIRQKIRRFVASNRSIVRLGTTEDGRKIFSNISKAKKAMEGKDLSSGDQDDFIAKFIGVKKSSVIKMRNIINGYDVSFDKPLKGSDGGESQKTYYDIFDEENISQSGIESSCIAKDFHEKLMYVIDNDLTEEERFIIDKRFLSDDLTYEEIGKLVGFSRQKVRQMEERISKKIKSRMKLHFKIEDAEIEF